MASKSDAIVKLVLVFVISLLSFAVGTFVGKKYSDQQHKITAYEPTNKDSHRGLASDKTTTNPAAEMTDEEIAKLAEEFVTDDTQETTEKVAETHADEKAVEHKEVEKTVAQAAATVKVEEKHAEPTKTVAKQEVAEPRQPSSVPKDVGQYATGKFTVQVASFNSEHDAKKRAEELKQKGFSAFYLTANIHGKTWYRVSVGQFPTEQEAKNYRAEFMHRTKIESAIIQKIVH